MASSLAESGPAGLGATARRGWLWWLAPTLVVASFGPYIITAGRGGVRLGQVLLYLLGIALVAVRGRAALRVMRRTDRLPRLPPVLVAAGIVVLAAAWALLS